MSEEKKTVLIIDDEPNLVELLRVSLTSRGLNVITARDGLEGLDVVEKTPPHMIILDVNMPRMGGIEFYNRIRDDQGRAKFPTLILTAREELRDCFDGVDIRGFMTKPAGLEEIYNEVQQILSEGRPGAFLAVRIPRENKTSEEKKKVLLVENDAEFSKELTLLYEENGYAVRQVSAGIEAVQMAMAEKPDIVLVKLALADFSGDLVAYELKLMPDTIKIPLVLYSRVDDRLNRQITQNLCKKVGLWDVFTFEDPLSLVRESDRLLEAQPQAA